MLLIVLGLPIGERGSWIERHASSADEANDLRSMLRLAADDVAVESPDPLIGQSCGPWRICRRLGEGGQGVVYEAEGDQGVAAVKVLHHGGDGETADKLNRETTALAAVDHNGLVRLRGSGVSTIAGRPRAWIAMDLIIGAEPLLDWAALHRPTMDERIELLVEIAASLAQAHAAGVIHRDLKSSNVLVGGDGRPRIIDLGIARVLGESHLARTRTNERHALVGTLDSLAPEQVDARLGGVTERTDVYALGVLAYRFLAGEVPYDTGISIVSAAQAILHVPPVPPEVFNRDLSASASAAIMRALEKHPADRWPSVAAFAAAIGPSSTTSATPHTDSRPRRRGLLLATCAVATTAAAFAVWMSVDGTNHKPPHGAGGGGIQEGDDEMKKHGIGAAALTAAVVGSAFAGDPGDDGTVPEGHSWSIEPVKWSEAEGGNGHWYARMCFAAECVPGVHFEFWPREQYVESVGGHLVTVTSAAEYGFMAQHGLGGHFGGYQDMNAADFSEPNGGWRWVTGEPFEWTNWGPGEPNNYQGNEHFVTSCCGGAAGNWNDGATLAWESVVEFEADCNGDGIVDYGQILDGTYEDADGNGVPDCCDAGEPCDVPTVGAVQWSEAEGGNGHWYEYNPTPTDWHSARSYALQQGADLASVSSVEENAFIHNLLPGVFGWIGGTDEVQEGDWHWSNGDTWDYTHWGVGEPNNNDSTYGEDYTYIVGAGHPVGTDFWYDGSVVDDDIAFVIEFESDCNGDGIVDYGQLLDGTYEDADGNGVPDCCEDDSCDLCAGDIFEDGAVTIEDLLILLAQYGTLGPEADIDGNGIVNVEDLLLLVGTWGDCP